MLSTILSQVGFPLLVQFVAQGLSKVSHPAAKVAREALGQVEEAIKTGGISYENVVEANRHAEAMATIRLKEYEASLGQVNDTLRAEILSQDKYVRRMRPTFGYLMAVTWGLQMGALAYVIVFDTAKAATLMHGMAALSTMWGVGLSVLGVYIYKRSEDKKLSQVAKDMLTTINYKEDIDREILPEKNYSKSNFKVNN